MKRGQREEQYSEKCDKEAKREDEKLLRHLITFVLNLVQGCRIMQLTLVSSRGFCLYRHFNILCHSSPQTEEVETEGLSLTEKEDVHGSHGHQATHPTFVATRLNFSPEISLNHFTVKAEMSSDLNIKVRARAKRNTTTKKMGRDDT